MSLLEKLWDDTVAGPRPDSGLGKLRKHSTFNSRSNTGKDSEVGSTRSYREGAAAAEDAVKVTRSIMILRPPQIDVKDSPPASPAGSTTPTPGSTTPTPGSTPPVSPFFTGGREAYRFRRRSASFAFEKAGGIGPRNPPPPHDL